MITLGLVDDEPLFSAGLSMILERQEDFDILWNAQDGDEAVEQYNGRSVDVVLMDIQMPGTDGIAATRRLCASAQQPRVIVLTTFDTDTNVLTAIEAGAAGFLLKNTSPAPLIEAIRTVHRGDAVIAPGPTRKLLTAYRATQAPGRANRSPSKADLHGLASLTERELEVLRLVAQALSNQEIGDRLWLSLPTVKTHVGNIMAKTDCRNRVDLALFAIRSGAVDQ